LLGLASPSKRSRNKKPILFGFMLAFACFSMGSRPVKARLQWAFFLNQGKGCYGLSFGVKGVPFFLDPPICFRSFLASQIGSFQKKQALDTKARP